MFRAWAAVVLVVACGGKKTAHEDAPPARPKDAASAAADAAAQKPARVEHTVWKLVDNRHMAHRAVDFELVISARDVGFARYTRFGMPKPMWRLARDIAGERAAIAERLASLDIPLTVDQAAATQVTVRVHAPAKKMALAIKVNGRAGGPKARVTLDPGWQNVAIPIERGRFVPGENQLALETIGGKGTLAVAWLRVGRDKPHGDDDPLAAASFDPKADALELASGAQLAWYVTIPDGANLVADVTGPCRVEVAARAGDGSLAGGLLGGDVHRVDLSPVAGHVARLALTARDCPRARVVHPRITLHGPEPTALPKADPPRYAIVWVIDGWRADKLAHAPNFEEIAKSSVTFRELYAQPHDFDAIAPALRDAGTFTTGILGKGPMDAEHALAALDKQRVKGPAYVVFTTTIAMPCPKAAAYDAAVAAADLELGKLVHQLQAWGIWDQTLLVVTSDRGVELAEDAHCADTESLRDALVHVPLLVHDPARMPGGTVVDEGTDSADVPPTIVAALGKRPADDAHGAPLESLAQGFGRGWARPAYASLEHAYAMRIGRWKARVGSTGVPWVGDMIEDPNELRDVAADRAVERRMLTDALGLYVALHKQWQEREWGVVTNITADGAAALDDAATP